MYSRVKPEVEEKCESAFVHYGMIEWSRRLNMIKTAGLRIWLVGALAAFAAVNGQAADLKTYKDMYEKESKEILQTFQPKFDGLQQQYQKSLEALKAGAQRRGDFKTTKAAADEIGRFEQAKSLPSAPDEAESPEIKAFQAAYTKQFAVWEMDMTAKLGALTVNYGQALDRLLKEQTRAGKLDEAAAVNQELEKAQAAIKGYAETLATLKGSTVTNGTVVAASPTPVMATGKPTGKKDLYMVVDVSGGKDAEKYPVTYLADIPKGGWTDEYKTDKLVLRKIEPGRFKMGSPEDETQREGNETQHKVTLTQAFLIGVFEVTQRQWELVMGNKPSKFNNSEDCASRPVETVSYDLIRGSTAGSEWPRSGETDADSFMGILRAKTGLSSFDLPTEAQWEYAARAGTDKSLAGNLDTMAWYTKNSGHVTHPVGQKRRNAWGLYDMHGNVVEWCLDWLGDYPGTESDPRGAASGERRVYRGGAHIGALKHCRSAYRDGLDRSAKGDFVGFRLALPQP